MRIALDILALKHEYRMILVEKVDGGEEKEHLVNVVATREKDSNVNYAIDGAEYKDDKHLDLCMATAIMYMIEHGVRKITVAKDIPIGHICKNIFGTMSNESPRCWRAGPDTASGILRMVKSAIEKGSKSGTGATLRDAHGSWTASDSTRYTYASYASASTHMDASARTARSLRDALDQFMRDNPAVDEPMTFETLDVEVEVEAEDEDENEGEIGD